MAGSFTGIVPQQYQGGVPSGNPMFLCTPAVEVPKNVPITIDWNLYGVSAAVPAAGVLINIAGANVVPIKQIRSIYIDNTFSASPVYVVFPDTNFTVFAPPGAIVMEQVVTNVLQATVYGFNFKTGTQPVTNILFMNIQMEPFLIPANFNINPVLTYTGAGLTLNVKTNPKTFVGLNLGPPQAGRLSILLVMAVSADLSTSRSLTGLTIDGANVFNNLLIDTSPFVSSGTVYARYVGLTTFKSNAQYVTASATLNANIIGLCFFAYSLTGQISDTPIDIGLTGTAITSAANSLDLAYNSGAVGVYGTIQNAALTTLVGCISDDNQTIGTGAGGVQCIPGHFQSPIDVTRTVSGTTSYLMGATWR